MLKVTVLAKLIIIGIMIATLSYFSYWGYEWVVYVLSRAFAVVTEFNFFDMLVGLIAMISSIPLFIGSFMAWRANANSVLWITIGSIGFTVKNVLEISSSVYVLSLLETVFYTDVQFAAQDIGVQLFQIALWIFVLFYFKKLADTKPA